jgi:glycosyltransferase involved in cell wall biosynthesis
VGDLDPPPATETLTIANFASTWLADQLVATMVPPCDIFHTMTAICLRSLLAAKRQGAVTIIDNASMHPRDWQREALEECSRFNVDPRDCGVVLPEPLIRRREREYELCDRIVVPSAVAKESFVRAGQGIKVDVVPLGVDHERFMPVANRKPSSVFRVCYVGRIELAKGLPYLLKAWKTLSLPSSELLLVGEVRREMKTILQEYPDVNIRFAGWLPPAQVAECYKDCDLFVFPSVHEGLAVVLLEAMASGLPVIATEPSGAQDCVTEGKDGFIVPPRDPKARADAIQWCYQHRGETAAMGAVARATIERQFTLQHYAERLISLYRSLASERSFAIKA